MSKVFVLGLDGATYALLKPWIASGKLPNLKQLIDKGFSCVLHSTYMDLSGVAWTSMTTGKNPGKHGIYDFITVTQDYKQKLLRSYDKKALDIFDILTMHKKKCIVYNIPLTFPAKNINGIFMSGFPADSLETDYIRPKTEKAIFEKLNPNYRFFVDPFDYKTEQSQAFFEDSYKTLDSRFTIIKHYLKKDWDLFFAVLEGTDSLKHYTWDNKILLEYYERIDRELPVLLNSLPKDCTIIVLSDHGFQKTNKQINLNYYLKKKDYLQETKNRKLIGMGKRMLGSKLSKKLVTFLKTRGGLGPKPGSVIAGDLKASLHFGKTTAFAQGVGGIYLNRKNYFTQGILEENKKEELAQTLVTSLQELTDPATGKKVFKEVHQSHEIFKGPYMEHGPDIIVVPHVPYGINSDFGKRTLFENLSKEAGRHSAEGIFIIHSSQINKHTQIKCIQIEDVAPILLRLLGCSVPEDLDGKLPQDMFAKLPKIKTLKDKTITIPESLYNHTQVLSQLEGYSSVSDYITSVLKKHQFVQKEENIAEKEDVKKNISHMRQR